MTKRGRGAPPRYDDAFKEGAVKLVTEHISLALKKH